MRIHRLKNQKGFSHHFILPVLAFMLVAGIGSYVMLRSSSAEVRSDLSNCYGRKISKNWKTCKDIGYLFSKWHGGYYQYKVRIANADKNYKYIEIVPISKTYKFDKGRTKVHVTPGKWSFSCPGNGEQFIDLTGRKIVKVKSNIKQCSTTIHYDVVQNGPQNGYVNSHSALKGDALKI